MVKYKVNPEIQVFFYTIATEQTLLQCFHQASGQLNKNAENISFVQIQQARPYTELILYYCGAMINRNYIFTFLTLLK